jgi:hypothetical protein
LPPGTQVRQAFICQTAPNFAFFVINWATGLTMFWIKYRCVAVAQDAIYVPDGYKLSGGARPTSIAGTREMTVPGEKALYLNPPPATVLISVDEKAGIQVSPASTLSPGFGS